MPRRKHLPMSRKGIFIILMCSIIIISFRKVHTSVFWHWLPKAAPSPFFSHMSNIFTANFLKTEGKSSALKHFINYFYVKLRLKQFSPSLCVALGLPKILPILFEILTSSDMEDYVSDILRFLLKYHKMVEIRPKKWFFWLILSFLFIPFYALWFTHQGFSKWKTLMRHIIVVSFITGLFEKKNNRGWGGGFRIYNIQGYWRNMK